VRRQDRRISNSKTYLNEVPEAFTFHLVGEEAVSGGPAGVITADPRVDYKPKDRRARLISKLRGKIWIDKGEYQWVKVDAEAIGCRSAWGGSELSQVRSSLRADPYQRSSMATGNPPGSTPMPAWLSLGRSELIRYGLVSNYAAVAQVARVSRSRVTQMTTSAATQPATGAGQCQGLTLTSITR